MKSVIAAGLVLSVGHGNRLEDGVALEVNAGKRGLFGKCVSQVAPGTAF